MAKAVVTVNTTHMPSRTISIRQQVATVRTRATVSRQGMADNSQQHMDSKVDITSSPTATHNRKQGMDNSKLGLLHGRMHRPTQAATMLKSRVTMHMVSIVSQGNMNVLLIEVAEMGAVNGQAGGQKDPNSILNACREIDRGIDSIEAKLKQLSNLQAAAESEVGDQSPITNQIRDLSTDTTAAYSSLLDRIKKIKSDPESGSPRNAPQVGRVQRRLQGAFRQYQQLQLDHRNQLKAQSERAIRIVNPAATDEEVREAVDDPQGAQVFRTAVCTLCQRFAW
jgi:hypothetical protein